MSKPSLKLITTQDGSHSLLREDLNETYHSFHGAMGESVYVFIEQCLDPWVKANPGEPVKIFEVGFGTGLNAWLAAIYSQQHQLKVEFHTVEPIPVPKGIYSQFNYGQSAEQKDLLQKIHDAEWETLIEIHSFFSIIKYETTLEAFSATEGFNCIFFDAFAPSKQAEVWSIDNIQKCYDICAEDGILSTYCAQGQFKRNLKAAGFAMETLKGAMGKKEMVIGRKSISE